MPDDRNNPYDKKRGELINQHIKIVDRNNEPLRVNYLISDAGGQGDVYHVTFKSKDYALKWYCKHPDDVIGGSQYTTIYKICGEEKRPDNKFIWPICIMTEENPENGKRFGYIMELLPDGYYEMEYFLKMDQDPNAVHFSGYNAMLNAGMNIASAMQSLHLKGWSYKDLNPKNFTINPETGDVLVVDNDNVSVDGDLCSVKGTKGYMAPEIPRSNYRENPSRETDYYSLAIVLYRLFFIDHPMDGKAFAKYPIHNDKVSDYLYATKPVFHFDPYNTSNSADEVYAPNALQRWGFFNDELKELFIRTFTVGIEEYYKRPAENEWIIAISKMRDKLIMLDDHREHFVNFSKKETIPKKCLYLRINNGNIISVFSKKAIYEISINSNHRKYANRIAGILYDEKIDRFRIVNLTDKIWRYYSPITEQKKNVSKGESYPLFHGVKIEFQRENPKIIGEIINPFQNH